MYHKNEQKSLKKKYEAIMIIKYISDAKELPTYYYVIKR